MVFLADFNFELPLTNPVIIFSLVLFVILFAPILLQKIKVPHIIGLIVAGIIVGPYGLNLLRRDSSIVLFGTVGLLYIMFLAGLEIDLSEFKKNRNKILVFGLFTFILPLSFGTLASHYILGFSTMSSILLASMFSSHTLISYPIASKYGVSRNRSVSLAVGGTMITDILALLILAIVAGSTKENISTAYWVQFGISSIVFVLIVFLGLPFIIRWFFKRFNDSVSQYIFVLAIVFLSAFLAEAAGLEGIIGAFFSGLILNKFIPHTSPLMNRIDFVGNALFIPFFLIGVGMLVDVRVLTHGFGALKVAGVIVVVAVITKYLAAWLTQKLFKMSKPEGQMLFGLTTSHAAATLAIILVGYNIIIGETTTGEPIRLLNEDVLNGTILLILVSCAISSFAVEKASVQLAREEEEGKQETDTGQRIMVALSQPESVPELVDMALMLKPHKSKVPVYALHVVRDDSEEEGKLETAGKKILDKAVRQAAAAGDEVIPLLRHDANISNGIVYSLKEHQVSDLIIGLRAQATAEDFWGNTIVRMLARSSETLFIYKPVQPLNTLKRMIVLAPAKAETDPGFEHWFAQVITLARDGGMTIVFYAPPATLATIQELHGRLVQTVGAAFHSFSNWEDFLFFSGVVKNNDLFLIITSRPGNPSYDEAMKKLPYYLTRYFTERSCLLIYPQQAVAATIEPQALQPAPATTLTPLAQRVQKIAGWKRFFNRKQNG